MRAQDFKCRKTGCNCDFSSGVQDFHFAEQFILSVQTEVLFGSMEATLILHLHFDQNYLDRILVRSSRGGGDVGEVASPTLITPL
jgi:hypothetical protein